MTYSEETKRFLRQMQCGERTEHLVYAGIARMMPSGKNREVLERIADEERQHAEIWKELLQEEVPPRKLKAWRYILCARLFGYTFVLKLMERGESSAADRYAACIAEAVPQAKQISEDEKRHEAALLEMLDEERLQYVGSMVLGLSDALVELTGTLAGLTFALKDTRLVALSGLITGISATLSMASSEFLSSRAEDGEKNALKASFYTGSVYLATVILLVLPYLLFPKGFCFAALAVMLGFVVVEIAAFTWYLSVAKNLPFGKRFREMAGISLSVAVLSFGIGILISKALGIEV